jgi:tRNA(Ile)-lysidine synthase
MLSARDDALPRVSWRGGELRRYADRLFAFSGTVQPAAAAAKKWDWRARPWLALAGGGALGLVRDRHGDVQLAALPRVLRVCQRRGGERLQAAPGRQALKDLLQAQGVAPWERAAVPLIEHRGRIIAVADLWLDRAYRAREPAATGRGRFRWRRATAKGGAAESDDCD